MAGPLLSKRGPSQTIRLPTRAVFVVDTESKAAGRTVIDI